MPASVLDQIKRQITLHNMLALDYAQGNGGLYTKEILDVLDCERKALYKYAEELRILGAPIEYERQIHVWRYNDAWNYPAQILETISGPVALRLAMDLLLDPELARGLEGRIALDPVLQRSGTTTIPRLTGQFQSQMLGQLASALKESRKALFTYTKPGETEGTEREVDPLGLFEWDGMVYLQAIDVEDETPTVKRFALSRITNLTILAETFNKPSEKSLPSCLGAFCANVFTATIVADPTHAPYAKERKWHPQQTSTKLPDGSLEFRLPFGDLGEATRWILGKGPGYKPVEPAELVSEWKSTIQKLNEVAASV